MLTLAEEKANKIATEKANQIEKKYRLQLIRQ